MSSEITTTPPAALPAPAAPRALAPIGRRELGAALPPFPFDPLLDSPAPRTRGTMIFGMIIFLLFVVGGAAWAVFAPLAEASIAAGTIRVEGTRRTIQHLEGGIVREILVRDGDSEAALTQALERLKAQDTTVILVSHRPTLVQGVDKVLLLKDGAMEMFGPRAEVLKRLMTPPRPAEIQNAPVARLEGNAAR